MLRRLCAVVALAASGVAVAVVLLAARSDTRSCTQIDYAGFRTASKASEQLTDIGGRIASCDALAKASRARVRALLGDPSPLDDRRESWRLGAGAMDDNVLIVAYDANDRVKRVQVAWR